MTERRFLRVCGGCSLPRRHRDKEEPSLKDDRLATAVAQSFSCSHTVFVQIVIWKDQLTIGKQNAKQHGPVRATPVQGVNSDIGLCLAQFQGLGGARMSKAKTNLPSEGLIADAASMAQACKT